MKLELIYADGKPIGYNLVAEDNTDSKMLETVQNLHFLESNKQEKIQYAGVTLGNNAKTSRAMFLQRKYAILPDNDIIKQEIYKAILKKGVPV